MGILHIVVDGCLHLFLALRGVDGFGSTLADIAGTIELGALAAVPDRIQCHFLAGQCLCLQFLWNDGVTAAHASETGSLRIAVEFYCHLSGSTDFVDRMRNFRVGDICLVGCIIEDDALVLDSVVYPFSEFLFRDDRTRRVVWIAEINHIHTVVWNLRDEVIAFIARHVGYVTPLAILKDARSTYHHVRIYINRINRVGNADVVIPSQNLLDISRIALGSIVHEDLVGIEMNATGQEVVLDDSLAEEVVASLRTVASERSLHSHLVYSLVHCLDDGRAERLGYITDAQTDYSLLWMGNLVGCYLLCDVGEQVIACQLQEMFIN